MPIGSNKYIRISLLSNSGYSLEAIVEYCSVVDNEGCWFFFWGGGEGQDETDSFGASHNWIHTIVFYSATRVYPSPPGSVL